MTEKKRFTITMSDSFYEYLEKLCEEKGLSKSAMITLILNEYKKGEKWAWKKSVLAKDRSRIYAYIFKGNYTIWLKK